MHPLLWVADRFRSAPASPELSAGSRLLLALIFGAVGGLERQWHHKIAGVKTNTLVAVGSTAFALVSARGFGLNSNPAQIAAGVVSGIGFIGAGVIMRRSGSVQGINTAANLWATAAMGLALGGGYLTLGAAILLSILLTQVAINRVGKWIDTKAPRTAGERFTLTIDCAPKALPEIQSMLDTGSDHLLLRSSTSLAPSPSTTQVEEFLGVDRARMQSIGDALMRIEGITRIEWARTEVAGEHESG